MKILFLSRFILSLYIILFTSCNKTKNIKSTDNLINATIKETGEGIKIKFFSYGSVNFSNKKMLDGWRGLATRQNDSIFVLISRENAYRLIEPPIGRVKVIVMDPYKLHGMYEKLLERGTLNVDTIKFDNYFD